MAKTTLTLTDEQRAAQIEWVREHGVDPDLVVDWSFQSDGPYRPMATFILKTRIKSWPPGTTGPDLDEMPDWQPREAIAMSNRHYPIGSYEHARDECPGLPQCGVLAYELEGEAVQAVADWLAAREGFDIGGRDLDARHAFRSRAAALLNAEAWATR